MWNYLFSKDRTLWWKVLLGVLVGATLPAIHGAPWLFWIMYGFVGGGAVIMLYVLDKAQNQAVRLLILLGGSAIIAGVIILTFKQILY